MIGRRYDVIVVGSATKDIFVDTADSLFNNQNSKFPFGSKILARSIVTETGGGGTNVSVSLARLKLKVAYIGKLGDDETTHEIIASLKKEKVNTSLIKYGNGKNGISIIVDSDCCDRVILTLKGINDKLTIHEINLNKLRTKWFYFCTMLGQSFKTIEKIAEYAKSKKIDIAFNPSTYLAKKGHKYLMHILSATTILILNKEEAGLLSKEKNIYNMLKKLHNFGPKIVCITDGKNGSYSSDSENVYYLPTSKKKPVEATGAGDAYGSTFLAGIIYKFSLPEAMKLAQANAESVIAYIGAKNKLLTYDEVLHKVKSTLKVRKLR